MLILKILSIFFCIFNCVGNMCPINEYFDNGKNHCAKCSQDCEECKGPNPSECTKWFPNLNLCLNEECKKCIDHLSPYSSTTAANKPVNFQQGKSDKEISLNETLMLNFTTYFVIIAFTFFITVFLCICTVTLSCFLIRKTSWFYSMQRHNMLLRNTRGGPLMNYNEETPDKVYYKGFPSKVCEGNLLLTQKKKIGKGAFGNVYKDAIKEREALAGLCHLHIIELLSINMKENLILIMPLRKDNLKNFLSKEKEKISTEDQIRYSLQTADAFRYISYKKLVHGDLKASNILVVNRKHIEVSDFGKCEAIESLKRTTGTITHTALELMDKVQFPTAYLSEKTDVWSFGVTVWEIFNLCLKNPYYEEILEPNKSKRLNEFLILDFLCKGHRLTPPENMHQQLQTTIINWEFKECDLIKTVLF